MPAPLSKTKSTLVFHPVILFFRYLVVYLDKLLPVTYGKIVYLVHLHFHVCMAEPHFIFKRLFIEKPIP